MKTTATTLTSSRTDRFRLLLPALIVAATVAAMLLALGMVGVKPARAAFPGTNGKLVFVSDRTTGTGVDNPTADWEIFTMNKDGKGVTQLTANTADEYGPSFSAGGNTIAFTSERDDNLEIYLTSPGGGTQLRVTDNTVADEYPTISPDGSKIAYDSKPNDNFEIIAREAGVETNLTNDPKADFEPVFSPEGTKIAFVSDRDGDTEIYVMDTDPLTDDAKPLTNNTVGDDFPEWSPDGKKIAFRSFRDGNQDIYAMNALDGSSKKRLTKKAADDTTPAFSPDGKRIAFMSRRDGGDDEIYSMKARPEGSKNRPINLTKNDVDDFEPDWQPLVN
jgi:Tol biopolymer transport system component